MLLVIAPLPSYAEDPPAFVFLPSDCIPGIVFREGIPAAGNDENVLRHATGASNIDGSSAYISTSTSLRVVHRVARLAIIHAPLNAYWVYLIRPTPNFFDLTRSLFDAFLDAEDPLIESQAFMLWYGLQHDYLWTARNGITNDQILGAASIILVRGEPVIGDYVPNPFYRAAAPTVNPDPLPVQNASNDAVFVQQGEVRSDFVDLVIAPDCHDDRAGSSANRQSCDATQITYEVFHRRNVAKNIAIDVLTEF